MVGKNTLNHKTTSLYHFFMIPRETIDRINDLPILEVCKHLNIELKQKGANYQACCPLHNEKTPSFMVSPGKNIFKCFGCGEAGGPVTLVMKHEKKDWIDAVNILAGAFHIDIPKEPETPEQQQEYKQREVIITLNEVAQKYFLQNLQGKPLEYAKSRWDTKTISQWGLGFAPDDWHGLDKFFQDCAVKRDAAITSGLLVEKDKNIYDFFRNRITFPVHNQYGRITGFSARILGKDEPKYLNSKESEAFHKNQQLFGIFFAYKAIREKGFAYLVEGAPDVIRMHHCGADNTVAPLGTGLTANHLKELKRYCKSLTFVIETDEAGINAVIRNAKKATNEGFSVSVLALPEEKDEHDQLVKHDPDSFFRNKEQLKEYQQDNTHDFIIWMGNRLLANATDHNLKHKHIDDICELIATKTEPGTVEMYLHNMAALVKPKKMWADKVKALQHIEVEKEEKQSLPKSISQDHFDKYGFYEDHNCVYFATKNGITKGANFTLQPLFHVASVNNSKRLYRIRNEANFSKIIELKQEELINLSKFKVRVESLGNFLWYLGESELGKYKSWLYEKTDTCEEITQLGWQKDGFFAWGNGIFNETFHEVDEYGIVREHDNNWYLPAFSQIYITEKKLYAFERSFIHKNNGTISLYDYTKLFIKVFGDNAIVGMCFLYSTLFRDIIVKHTAFFPMLNMFGPKGAGKSHLGKSLTSFFIINNKAPNLVNSTIPAIADAVSQCANAIVHLDEYSNDLDYTKIEMLKGLYDLAGRTRMSMDLDKKREITSVDCGICISGQQMPTVDIALFSRVLFITFPKTQYTDEENKNFEKLKSIEEKGLSHITNHILQLRKYFEKGWLNAFEEATSEVQKAIQGENIESRIYRNWTILVASFKVIDTLVKHPFDYSDVLRICINSIKLQNGETKRNNELSNFWGIVEYLVKDGLLLNEIDFYVKMVTSLKTDKLTIERFDVVKKVLILNHTKTFQLYRKHGKVASDKILPISTIQYYLQNSKEFMGIKKSVAFKNSGIINADSSRSKYQVTNAYVFDYDMLGISIDYVASDGIDSELDFMNEKGNSINVIDKEEDKQNDLPF